MADAYAIRPLHNPLEIEVRIGAIAGGVELEITAGGCCGATVLLDTRTAELVTLALQGAVLRVMLGDDHHGEDEAPDYGWLEG